MKSAWRRSAVKSFAVCCVLVLVMGCQSQTESSRDEARAADKSSPRKRDADSTDFAKANSGELLAHIRKLAKIQLEEDTRKAVADFVNVQKSIVRAIDELIARGKLDEDVRTEMIKEKWLALIVMARLEEPGAEEASLKLTNEMIKDKNRALARMARLYMRHREVTARMRGLMLGKNADAGPLVVELRAALNDEEVGATEFDLVRNATSLLESLGKYDQAVELYRAMKDASGRMKDKEEAEAALKIAERGIARLGLMGQQTQFTGTQFDGASFDLADFKGKVVLVDFWATWCGPCLAEMPNVKRQYAKYRDRGFEVVGLSLDSDKETLGEFLTKQKLPWIVLWTSDDAKDDEGSPFERPLPKQFGVDGLPSTFLVDQQGKIVSIGIRGERLGEKLAELLGEPDENTEQEKKAAAD